MQIRDRITELRRVRAGDLRPNPRNWRTHPPEQADALRGVLAEVGYADALLARECEDGSLELIDGHLRAETTPDATVPVLVLDLSAEEADKVLLSHDPLAAMAGVDRARLGELLGEFDTESDALADMLTDLAKSAARAEGLLDQNNSERPEFEIPESFQVVVECGDESDQRAFYERMTGEGYHCRLMTL